MVTPAGEGVLIDTGNPGGRDPGRIIEAAKAAGLAKIDYVLLTHFHGDHFGGGAEVAQVLHPALPGNSGYDIWARDFTGAGGLFSFVLNGGDDAARAALIDGLDHFGIGYSWGGPMSLVVPYQKQNIRTLPAPHLKLGTVVRFCIGFEDVADLQADIEQAIHAALV